MRPKPITLAIEKAGSVKALAEQCGVAPQAISQWKHVPIDHVRTVETLTGLSKHEIRPDVYDPPQASV
jgi:DNA-binding transcriptional regulator YdaS (Cro superfamily)